jgi:GPH family glycoside/pentoside/hexuronide:cation symporter
MKFFADGALVLPALAGNALLIGKFWDAVNDPLFGWLADRTNSRFDRRRVFMIFGAIPLAISIALLWFVPQGMSRTLTFLWIAITFLLFDTAWTLTNVPYYALTGELTDDYDERSALTTTRMVMAVPAYLIGVALTPVIVGLFAIEQTGWGFIGILSGIICVIVLLVSAYGIRERQVVLKREAKTSIRLFFGPIPALAIIIALPLLIKYPLNRKKHNEARKQLEGQDAQYHSESA